MNSSRKQEEVDDANNLDYGEFALDSEVDDEAQQANMETHIPETNVGYRLLQRMGWKAGQGLGSQGQGRKDPVPIDLKLDSLGVGKAGEENAYHVSSTAKRKALDSEKQLEETHEEKQQREVKAVRQEAIARELQVVKRAFYCELCDKQYRKISEYEQHLQSYDHHHRKRFKDMKAQARKSSFVQSEKEKKRERERKREERELKRMQEAMRKPTSAPSDKKESVPVAHGNVGWTPVPKSSSNESRAGGGWTTVAAPSQTGGWATVQTSQPPIVAKTTTMVSNATTKQLEPIPPPTVTTTAATATAAPVKLSFGMPQKKQGGFQFGLKKK
ncbi:G patch domain-containing protein 8 [Apophysomyces sp. BC1034]|nr:G patch domain-containing protein 8 [Apophysomyces sp. BC1015]KAG0177730.1 G patch domain-containing protein 8 [Apophysomyces sp. BC1021]KAG0184366.1 G patch domain-containing protein 8 [Apophysomyces sp. BC1034]